MDCVTENYRVFGITEDWKTVASDPGAWRDTECEGGWRFMATWVREEDKPSEKRREKDKRKKRTSLRLHLG